MKARQIIPGWPRGRSVGWNKHHLWNDPPYTFIFCKYHTFEMHEHAIEERAYHAGQQEMVNEYFEQRRTHLIVSKGVTLFRFLPRD